MHFYSLPKVQAFFLAPYIVRRGAIVEGEPIPAEEMALVYRGLENLLLELYEELPEGGRITDEAVTAKIEKLVST